MHDSFPFTLPLQYSVCDFRETYGGVGALTHRPCTSVAQKVCTRARCSVCSSATCIDHSVDLEWADLLQQHEHLTADGASFYSRERTHILK